MRTLYDYTPHVDYVLSINHIPSIFGVAIATLKRLNPQNYDISNQTAVSIYSEVSCNLSYIFLFHLASYFRFKSSFWLLLCQGYIYVYLVVYMCI